MNFSSDTFLTVLVGREYSDLATVVAIVLLIVILAAVMMRSSARQRRQNRTIRLQESELSLQRRAAELHAMVHITRADGRITYVNENLMHTTGFDADEILGKSACDVLLDQPGEAEQMMAALSRGDVWTGESRLRRRNGGILWTHATCLPQLDGKGQLRKAITVHTDITESKLRQQEGPLRAMFDRLQDEVYIFTVNGLQMRYMNKTARASLGWDGVNYQNRHLSETTSDFDERDFMKRAAPLIAGETGAVIYESTLMGRPVEINLQIDESMVGEARFISVVRDISQRKEVEQARAAFVATVTHELRAPMTSIKGAMKLVASGATGPIPEKPSQMIDLALRNVDRLLVLINDLLDLEKLDNAETEIRRDPVDLGELVKEAIEHNMGYAEEYGVRFALLPGMPGGLRVCGDRDRLMQVLTNLMSNAAKFSEVGGVVEVGLEDRDEDARILVIDHGIGIPEDAQSRLFERFVQAETTEHKKRKGTGLGLSIVKTIVERHGGRVSFVSAPGQGTTFVIDLPKVEREMSCAA